MSRFDWRYELENIAEGMEKDLQQVVGQTVPWFVFDSADTGEDPVYDVGSTTVGRTWYAPIFLPVLGAIKLEADEVQNDEGFYLVDTLRVIFSIDAARKAGLQDIILRPDQHDLDRIVYENKVFAIDQIRIRGMLTAGYTTGAADCKQVKDEELDDDATFWAQYINNNYTS